MIDLELDGWEIAEESDGKVVYVSDDRMSKIEIVSGEFTFQGEGWIVKLWTSDSPYAGFTFETSFAHTDPEEIREAIGEHLCDEPSITQ